MVSHLEGVNAGMIIEQTKKTTKDHKRGNQYTVIIRELKIQYIPSAIRAPITKQI